MTLSVRHTYYTYNCLLFYACQEKSKLPIQRGFYFWQTTYHFDSMPKDSL